MDIYSEINNNMPSNEVVDIKSFSNVILYGAGNIGKKLYKELLNIKVRVEGIIDQNADSIECDDVKVYDLKIASLQLNKKIPVILSGLFGKKNEDIIRTNLRNIGFANIYSLYQLDWHDLINTVLGKTIFIGDYDIKNIEQDIRDIELAYNLFEQPGDRAYFLKYISAYIYNNFSDLSGYNYMEKQYSGDGIEKIIDYKRFIDCGAYDGDSLRNLLNEHKTVEDYVALEPQLDLCNKIINMRDKVNVKNISVIPCGVSDSFVQNRFSVGAEGQSAGKTSEDGSEVIQCVPIDSFGDIVRPTFIKFDIEGMELLALAGAENTIRKYHPSLAVCVYHDLPHIWKIPKMIFEMSSDYLFYLRSYQIMGLETVLYAIPR